MLLLLLHHNLLLHLTLLLLLLTVLEEIVEVLMIDLYLRRGGVHWSASLPTHSTERVDLSENMLRTSTNDYHENPPDFVEADIAECSP